MPSLYLLLPISFLTVIGIGVAFWWAIFAGQFDDTNQAAVSILDDDDGGASGTAETAEPAPARPRDGTHPSTPR